MAWYVKHIHMFGQPLTIGDCPVKVAADGLVVGDLTQDAEDDCLILSNVFELRDAPEQTKDEEGDEKSESKPEHEAGTESIDVEAAMNAPAPEVKELKIPDSVPPIVKTPKTK